MGGYLFREVLGVGEEVSGGRARAVSGDLAFGFAEVIHTIMEADCHQGALG